MGFLGRFFRNRFVKKLLETDDPPRRIARGVAAGSFVAVMPLVGFQISLALVLAIAVRGNRIAAVAMTFVLNPFIIVPPSYWYFPAYYLGAFMLGMDPVGLSRITQAYEISSGVFELLGNLWSLGLEVYGPMLLGGVLIGAPIALIMYQVSLRIVLRHRAKREARKGSAVEMGGGEGEK